MRSLKPQYRSSQASNTFSASSNRSARSNVTTRHVASRAKLSDTTHREEGISHTSAQSPAEAIKSAAAAALNAACVLTAALALNLAAPYTASALLNSPNAQIPRTVDAALRRSIPAFNPGVAKLQQKMEDIAFLLRIPQRKPWANMASNVAACVELLNDRKTLLEGVPPAGLDQANADLDNVYTRLRQLELSIKTQQPDRVSIQVADVLKSVADLEIIEAPGLPYTIPKEYAGLPRLTGRAVVQLTVERADGEGFVDREAGGVRPQGTVELTLDGYSAPISAGGLLAGWCVQRPAWHVCTCLACW